MKVRKGFVANSSSSCFILDLREEPVKQLLKRISANPPSDLGRETAMAIGKEAMAFAQEHREAACWDEDEAPPLTEWILKWAEELGEDNIVFLRESDEGMGGYLFGSVTPPDYPDWPEKANLSDNPTKEEEQKAFEAYDKYEQECHKIDRIIDEQCPTPKEGVVCQWGDTKAYQLVNELAKDEMEYH